MDYLSAPWHNQATEHAFAHSASRPVWIGVFNRVVNPLVGSVLRSRRWHRLLSRHLALLQIEPRSGSPAFQIPVIYRVVAADRAEIRVGAAGAKLWWRNFRTPWPLEIWIEGRPAAATAVATERDGQVVVTVHFDLVPSDSARDA
jgi:hypothetical protein